MWLTSRKATDGRNTLAITTPLWWEKIYEVFRYYVRVTWQILSSSCKAFNWRQQHHVLSNTGAHAKCYIWSVLTPLYILPWGLHITYKKLSCGNHLKSRSEATHFLFPDCSSGSIFCQRDSLLNIQVFPCGPHTVIMKPWSSRVSFCCYDYCVMSMLY